MHGTHDTTSLVVPRRARSCTRNRRSPYAISVFFRSWIPNRVISCTFDIKTPWIASFCLILCYARPARNFSRKEYQGDILSIIEARIYAGLIKLKFHLWEREIDFKQCWRNEVDRVIIQYTVPWTRTLSSNTFFTAYIIMRRWNKKLLQVSRSLGSISRYQILLDFANSARLSLRLREHLNDPSLRLFAAGVKRHLGFTSEEARRTLALAGGWKGEGRRANRENRGEFYEWRHFSHSKKRNSLPLTPLSRLGAAQKVDCQRRKENVGGERDVASRLREENVRYQEVELPQHKT